MWTIIPETQELGLLMAGDCCKVLIHRRLEWAFTGYLSLCSRFPFDYKLRITGDHPVASLVITASGMMLRRGMHDRNISRNLFRKESRYGLKRLELVW